MPAAPSMGQVRNRKARVGPMVLPAAGRDGPPPAWPYDVEEPSLWGELWATPQAVAWESLGWVRVVARYTLVVLEAEADLGRPAKDRGGAMGEARQFEDRLGLTPKAMRLLIWTVGEPDEERGQVVAVTDERWRQAAAS